MFALPAELTASFGAGPGRLPGLSSRVRFCNVTRHYVTPQPSQKVESAADFCRLGCVNTGTVARGVRDAGGTDHPHATEQNLDLAPLMPMGQQ